MEIEKKLLNYGITPELSGFQYILESVKVIKTTRLLSQKDIFNSFKNDYNTKYENIERSIRTAIKRSINAGLLKKKCTSKELIFLLARNLI